MELPKISGLRYTIDTLNSGGYISCSCYALNVGIQLYDPRQPYEKFIGIKKLPQIIKVLQEHFPNFKEASDMNPLRSSKPSFIFYYFEDKIDKENPPWNS